MGPTESTDAATRVGEVEDLYRRRFRSFLRVAAAILGDRDQAYDAVQESFARALRHEGSLDASFGLEPWLYRVLVNHCKNLVRDSRRIKVSGEQAIPNGRLDEWPEVRAAVAALPERQRLVLFLRHYADLDYQQIAEALGIERGTVAATLHAAHGAVRRTIEEESA